MLRCIYIDNYRCFHEFEILPESISLIVGANGTGKSSIFDVLHKIQQLVGGHASAAQLFDRSSCTRWRHDDVLRFELSLDNGQDRCDYRLTIGFKEGRQPVIFHESVQAQGASVYWFNGRMAGIRPRPVFR